MAFQTRSYPMVSMPQPQPVNVAGSLADVMNMAAGAEDLKVRQLQTDDATRAERSRKAIEGSLTENKGNLPNTITALEGQGRWTEANALRGNLDKIREGQQKALAEQLKATREAFETSTRYLQGVESAETPEEKSRLFTAVRPRLVESLPGLEQYIPQRYEDDPGFVARAIPMGLSAADAVKRRADAVEALNKTWKDAGDDLARDKAIAKHLGPWVETADTAEEIGQIIDTAQSVYGASPGFAALFGELSTGPLTPAVKKELLGRLDRLPAPKAPKEPPAIGSFGDYLIRLAGEKGVPVSKLLTKDVEDAKGRYGLESGEPSQAQKGAAERWRANALAKLKQRQTESVKSAWPMSDAQYQAETTDIESSYQRQLGTSGGLESPPPFEPSPARPDLGAAATAGDAARYGVTTTILSTVKGALTQGGFALTEQNIKTFLADPANRQRLGLSATRR